MNKILTLNNTEEISSAEIEEIASSYPVFLQGSVRRAFKAAAGQNYQEAEELCCKILDQDQGEEIRMLLGTCYFTQRKMQNAQRVFYDLTQDYPQEEAYIMYLGMTYHALGWFKEAVKELEKVYPLSAYRPFYYTSYGDSLQEIGKLKQSCEMFRKEVAYFEKTKTIISPEGLDGAFQNLLYLDIVLGNGEYPRDLAVYYEFLDQVEMTVEMQNYLAGNIVHFCSLMSNKWYRPLFLEFISHVRERGFLTLEEPLMTLQSAFSSWESFAYHEDRQISALTEAYLSACYERKYWETDFLFDSEEKDKVEMLALTYEWYMCQYASKYPEKIEYIRSNYPYTYADNVSFLEKVEKNGEEMAKERLEKLYEYTGKKNSIEEFEVSMYQAYKSACGDEKEPVYVYDGMDTYKRLQPKIGRNDPCPCGSGKKYKKCCGK